MTNLSAIFGSTPDKTEEGEAQSEKLLNLYWKRAELKKEFAELRDEQFRLKDCIKQKEGATARLQQKLDHIEELLLDPEWVYNVVTYYQLRGFNLRCERRLAKFAEQLKQQREQKEHGQLLDEWNQHRAKEAEIIERQIGELRLQVQQFEDQLQSERHSLATMSGLLKLFRRRRAMRLLDELAGRIEAAQRDERTLLYQLDEVQNRQPPDTQGLSIATKRLINFMILSFAQQLFLHFCDDDLAALVKEAGDKSVGAINYGGKQSSDAIVTQVKKCAETLDDAAGLADILHKRATLIAENAMFRDDDDALPVTESVATLIAINANGAIEKRDANLLGENYWGVANVMSR